MAITDLPTWLTWQQRPFPNANLLVVHGARPALVDSGFVGHAAETQQLAEALAGRRIASVVNTHWHSDHVGGNARMQAAGAVLYAGAPEADAIRRRDPGCCVAEYLDQPVARYAIDVPLADGDRLQLAETEWQVVATPGHTPGHLALWHPDDGVLVVGDALSDYDVGWVCTALDGPQAAHAAVASIDRLIELKPRVLIPAHGPLPHDASAALEKGRSRASRFVDDPDGAVWYGARRIFGFALMIRDGIPLADVDAYLLERAWLQDAARLLRVSPEAMIEQLINGMRSSGAIIERDGALLAGSEYAPVPQELLDEPWPRDWPTT